MNADRSRPIDALFTAARLYTASVLPANMPQEEADAENLLEFIGGYHHSITSPNMPPSSIRTPAFHAGFKFGMSRRLDPQMANFIDDLLWERLSHYNPIHPSFLRISNLKLFPATNYTVPLNLFKPKTFPMSRLSLISSLFQARYPLHKLNFHLALNDDGYCSLQFSVDPA
jgi:hypothetical protein